MPAKLESTWAILPGWKYPLKMSFSIYSKTMFLGLNQVYNWGFKCNTFNNYSSIIKTKRNYNWKLFTIERRSTKQSRLGFGIDRAS